MDFHRCIAKILTFKCNISEFELKPNKKEGLSNMSYKIETDQAGKIENVTSKDIQTLFDNDARLGDFIILTVPDGSFLQA